MPAKPLAASPVAPLRGPLAPTIDQPSKRELDNAHITQLQNDRYLPDGRPWPTNQCGPTAAVNAVRLLGADIPGFAGERTRRVLDAARTIATGKDMDVGTYPHELARIPEAAGVAVVPATSTDSILARARRGVPTIILGDANATGGFDGRSVEPKRSSERWGHFVVVSGYDKSRGEYYVDDPGGSNGTQYAPAREIRAFKRGWNYEPDLSLVPGPGGKHEVKDPPPVPRVHSRQELRDAEARVRETMDEHSAGGDAHNPAAWDALDAARFRTPLHASYANRAYYRVNPDARPHRIAPDTRIATARTAKALLGDDVERSVPRTFDSLLAQVRGGSIALVHGDASRRGAWSDETVRTQKGHDTWALVAGYMPDTGEYLVDDPRYPTPLHVPASELRAFDRGAAGENVVIRRHED